MPKKVIIAGGGTGGHIFPAISIAGELRMRDPELEILFVSDQLSQLINLVSGGTLRPTDSDRSFGVIGVGPGEILSKTEHDVGSGGVILSLRVRFGGLRPTVSVEIHFGSAA